MIKRLIQRLFALNPDLIDININRKLGVTVYMNGIKYRLLAQDFEDTKFGRLMKQLEAKLKVQPEKVETPK